MPRPRGTAKERKQEKRLATGAGRLFGYIRVSTADQRDHGHSLAGQRDRLGEACKIHHFKLLGVTEEVESGAKQREALDDLWERVRVGEAEGIIFPKLDRLGRSQLHLASLIEQARDEGITLLSADEGLQVDKGKLVNEALPFLVALAQVERERISRRTKEGLEAARRKGVTLGAPPKNVDLQERATDLRRKGKTLWQIADTFNEEGHTTARGTVFRANTIYRMVRRVDPDALPEGGFPKAAAVAGV